MSLSKHLQLMRVNNHDIEPIKIKGGGLPLYGGDLIPYQFYNIMMIAKKGSGKTTCIKHILTHCCYPGFTVVIIFAATVHHDAVWVAIVQELEKLGVIVMTYTSITSDDGKGNYLKDWFDLQDKLGNAPEEPEDTSRFAKEKEAGRRWLIGSGNRPDPKTETKKTKPKKPKFTYAPFVFVFDDISNELNDPWLGKMLRQHRHYKAAVICSSQWYADLKKGGRAQIDIWILFPKLADDILEKVAENAGIDAELMKEMYHRATDQPHQFLYFDAVKEQFRKNFTHIISIEKEKTTSV